MSWDPPVPPQNLILLGDLNSNAVVARLYALGFCLADAFYPGKGGCVVRTIHDPWGRGTNVVLIGAANPADLRLGIKTFLHILPAGVHAEIPPLFRLVPGAGLLEHVPWLAKSPGAPAAFARSQVQKGRRALKRGRHTGVFGMIATMGDRYLWSGDDAYARAFVDLLFLAAEYRKTNPKTYGGPWGMDSDFMAQKVIPGWDNVEESPVITAAERLEVTRILGRWITEAVAPKAHTRLRPPRVRFNHKTFPALGCWYAGRYLVTYYPEIVEGPAWLRLGQVCFSVQAHAFKPMEDCNGYQWLTLGHMIQYALAARDAVYFQTGNAARDADYAILTMDNFGYQTPYGDTGSFRCWFSELPFLRKCAWYYDVFGSKRQRREAAEYAWALDKKSTVTGVFRLGEFARTIAPRLPTRLLGARAWPLDPMYYETFPARERPPLRNCFDKIVMRDGFDRNDSFLLLDGLSNGGHKHYDGNTISRITALGRIWLADNDYYKSQAKFHNGLIVFRNGQGQTPPPYVELLHCASLPGLEFAATALRDYAGTDWTRAIFFLEHRSVFLVVDDVRARNGTADYMVQAKWHGVGAARRFGNAVRLEQKGVFFSIQTAGDVALELVDDPALGADWRGYPYAPPVVRDITEIVRKRLAAGKFIRIQNLLCAADSAGRLWQVRRVPVSGSAEFSVPWLILADAHGPRAAVWTAPPGGRKEGAEFRLGPGAPSALAGQAAAVELESRALRLFGVRQARMGARFKFEAGSAVNLALSGMPTAGVLDCEERTRIRFSGPAVRGLRVDGKAVEAVGGTRTATFWAAPGRHTLRFSGGVLAVCSEQLRRLAEKGIAGRCIPLRRPRPNHRFRLAPAWTWRKPGPSDYLLTANPDQPTAVDAGAKVAVSPPPRKTNIFTGKANTAAALLDGRHTSADGSVQWTPDRPVTITVTFPRPVRIDRIVLEHWYAETSSKHRKYQLARLEARVSSDHFNRDIRLFGKLEDHAKHGNWGRPGYGPVAYTLAGKATPATELRLRVEPRRGAGVYLAELQVWGTGDGLKSIHGNGTLPVFPLISLAAVPVKTGAEPVWAGAEDGTVFLLRNTGALSWSRDFRKPVYAVAAADLDADGRPELLAGGADQTLHCFELDGRERWQVHPDHYHSAPIIRVLLAPRVDRHGRRLAVAGADNWRYTAWDAQGKRRWEYESVHRATAGAVPDLDGDGIQEVFCGTEYYWWGTARSRDGRRIWAYSSRSGPRVNAVAAGNIDADPGQEVIAGGADGNLHALDNANGRLLWKYNTGDEVTGVVCADLAGDGRREIVASSLGFDLVAVDGAGRRLWRLDTGNPVIALCKISGPGRVPYFVFANRDGRIGVVDRNGRFLCARDYGVSVNALIAVRGAKNGPRDRFVAALNDGRLVAFDLVKR